MFKLQCTYTRSDDGSYVLLPNNWRHGLKHKPLTLYGSEARIWENLLAFLNLTREAQRLLLQQLDRDISARLIAVISNLAKAGYLEIDADFALDANVIPQAPPLRKLHLEITHRCNFRCQACYIGPRLLAASRHDAIEGSTEQWFEVIRDAADLGCEYATVTGGEPFVRRDVLDILNELSVCGISIEINTNASCISPKIANALRSHLISSVEATVYGYDVDSAGTYTQLRTGYEATLRGIRLLVKHGIPVSVKYFATDKTLHGYQRVCDYLADMNVEVKLIGHQIHGDLFSGALPTINLQADLMDTGPVIQQTDLPCYPSVNALAVEPDGTIRACPKLAVQFGNVFEDGVEEVWLRSERIAAFRTFWVEYCRLAGYVRGGTKGLCPASNVLSQSNGLVEFRQMWDSWLMSATDVKVPKNAS